MRMSTASTKAGSPCSRTEYSPATNAFPGADSSTVPCISRLLQNARAFRGCARNRVANAGGCAQCRLDRGSVVRRADRDDVWPRIDRRPGAFATLAQPLHGPQACDGGRLPVEERRIGGERVRVHAQRVAFGESAEAREIAGLQQPPRIRKVSLALLDPRTMVRRGVARASHPVARRDSLARLAAKRDHEAHGQVIRRGDLLRRFVVPDCPPARDAARRGMNRTLWTLIVVFVPNAIGFILYFLLRAPLQMQCPKCGATMTRQANYCSNCRHAFYPTCPQCKTPVRETDKFCVNCGVQLGTPTELERS